MKTMQKQREGIELDLWREGQEQKRLLSEYYGQGYSGEDAQFHKRWKEFKKLNEEEKENGK